MKVSPRYIELTGNIPKNARVAKLNMSNPVKQAAVVSSAVAASALAASSLISPDITVKGIENNLIKRGFKRDENGDLYKTFTPEQKEKFQKKYGFLHKNLEKLFATPFSKEKAEEFKFFIEAGKERGKKLYNENFDNLFLIFKIMDASDITFDFMAHCKENKDAFKLLENLVHSNINDSLLTIAHYKADCSSEINTELRKKGKNPDYEIDLASQKDIDKLSDFISTQTLPPSLKLYRGEGYEILDKVLMNGKNIQLGQMMKEAALYNDDNMIAEIKELILDNEIEATEHGFMSLSMNEKVSESFAVNRVLLEVETKPDTKGAYLDGLNLINFYGKEDEVLLQKGSTIRLKDAEYDKEHNIWHLKVSVSN